VVRSAFCSFAQKRKSTKEQSVDDAVTGFRLAGRSVLFALNLPARKTGKFVKTGSNTLLCQSLSCDVFQIRPGVFQTPGLFLFCSAKAAITAGLIRSLRHFFGVPKVPFVSSIE
jgi:hypothetical protein